MLPDIHIGFAGQIALFFTACAGFLAALIGNTVQLRFCFFLFATNLFSMSLEDVIHNWPTLTLAEAAVDALVLLVVFRWTFLHQAKWLLLAGILLGLQVVWRFVGLPLEGTMAWAHFYNALYYLSLLSCLGGIVTYAFNSNFNRGSDDTGWTFSGRSGLH